MMPFAVLAKIILMSPFNEHLVKGFSVGHQETEFLDTESLSNKPLF